MAVSLLLALLPAASGYVIGVQHVSASPVAQRTTPASMAAKGFGKAAPPPPPKPKTAGAAKRDAAGKAFDDLKATGAPEYMVFIRTVDAAGTASDWNPVGGIAVPRSNSVDMAVSMAIYNNEEELLKGAKRSYPKLKVERRPRCVRIGRPLHCWQSRAATSDRLEHLSTPSAPRVVCR